MLLWKILILQKEIKTMLYSKNIKWVGKRDTINQEGFPKKPLHKDKINDNDIRKLYFLVKRLQGEIMDAQKDDKKE